MSQWQPDPRQQQPQPRYLPPWQPQQGYQQQPPYQQPYAPQRPPQPRRPRRGLAFLGCGGIGALVVLIAALAASHSSSSSSAPPAAVPTVALSQAAAPASAAAAAQAVTYVVTGSDADVTYGPAGSDFSGTVPLDKTAAIPSSPPVYYAVSAQLQGGGTVSCKIEVDGKVISQATASGGYNIASCEVSQDPLTGTWQDTNA